MMLDDPASGGQLPASIKVSDGPQSGQKGINQCQAGENQKNPALEREIFSSGWACGGRNHSSRV